MSIKGIIFDFDGTLFDSMSIWETAGTDYLASLGITSEKGLRQKLKTMSLLQSAEYMKERYSLPLTVESIIDGINRTVEDFYFHTALPKENVTEFLSALREKGIKLCIATATDRCQVEAALKRCDMLRFFGAIFTCSEVGHGKDEPFIFECAREHLKTAKSETAVFEDALHAARTAKNAGFFTVGVYDRFEASPEELKALTDVYVDSYSEAERLLNI